MLPSISAVLSVEMIRDGGSLAATFLDGKGSKYCLFFQLLLESRSPGMSVPLGYAAPVVFERLEFGTEEKFEWHSANEVVISWEHATILLRQMRDLLQPERHLEWLHRMEEVADSGGKLPPDLFQDGS